MRVHLRTSAGRGIDPRGPSPFFGWPPLGATGSIFSPQGHFYFPATKRPGRASLLLLTPSGWSYPSECCSGRDRREVADKAIGEEHQGYVIRSTGEFVGYRDSRVKESPIRNRSLTPKKGGSRRHSSEAFINHAVYLHYLK